MTFSDYFFLTKLLTLVSSGSDIVSVKLNIMYCGQWPLFVFAVVKPVKFR